jgi:hypothetical protein
VLKFEEKKSVVKRLISILSSSFAKFINAADLKFLMFVVVLSCTANNY